MAGVCQNSDPWALLSVVTLVLLLVPSTRAQLVPGFYATTCPQAQAIVISGLASALSQDFRVGASLLRMHFHDCFVQGCDGSVLLVDTGSFQGEQSALPNLGSLRGFNVVNDIKASIEASCPGVVSCADILALIARDAVVAAGGPPWPVLLGRRDSTTACLSCANSELPSPLSGVSALDSAFAAKGLDENDMVTLSGAHTFGKARCAVFGPRLFNFQNTGQPDPSIAPSYLALLQALCPQSGSQSTTEFLDTSTQFIFDNRYYDNLLVNEGLLLSDQSLQSEGGSTASLVTQYSVNQAQFFSQFTNSMIKMGNINPLTGSAGEIRTNCQFTNAGQ